MSTTAPPRRKHLARALGLAVIVALLAATAIACEPRVSGRVLIAGDFTAAEASPWITQSINVGTTGLLPSVNALDTAGVRDERYWVTRFDALSTASGEFDAIVLSLGINDVAADAITPDLPQRIATVADAALDGGRTVLWPTLPEIAPQRRAGAVAFNQALREAAASRPKLRVMEFGAVLAAQPTYLKPDQVHWSRAGQQAFAQAVAVELATIDRVGEVTIEVAAETESAAVGDAIDVAVTVTNSGPVTLRQVAVDDPAAPDCSRAFPDLEAGASHTERCSYTATTADVGVFRNTASVTTDRTGRSLSNDMDVPVAAPTATIQGTVTDAEGGDPVPGAWVVALRAADLSLAGGVAVSDDGDYSLAVGVGSYAVLAIDPADGRRLELDQPPPSHAVGAGDATVADVVLGPGPRSTAAPTTTVVGRVTEAGSGAPLADAWVMAIAADGSVHGAVTGDHGGYRVEVPVGAVRVLMFDPDGGHIQAAGGIGSFADARPLFVGDRGVVVNTALAKSRPNVVLFLTDDQTLESMRVMPRVQHLLADQGTTFTNSIVTFPLCCPARATLLTGQYAHNHHVVNNVAVTTPPNPPIGGSGALDHSNTLATWLHAGGYQTAHVGKYLNCWGNTTNGCRAGAPAVPPGWDDWFGLIDPFPAAYGYFDFDVLDNDVVRHVGPSEDIYQTDVLADRAVADIGRMARNDQPFFLNIWPQAPHAGRGPTAPSGSAPAPAPRHVHRYTTEEPPSTPAVGEVDVSDKPYYIRCGISVRPTQRPNPGCRQAPSFSWSTVGLTSTYRATLQSLLAVDEMVSRVVAELSAAGELDNTVVIFTSDNGFQFGEHRLNFRKVVPYEESIHVPLIVRGPGFPVAHEANQLVGNIDLAPTIVSLAGAEPRRVMDGRALAPLAQDPTLATNRALLIEDWPVGSFLGIPPHYDGIRTQNDVYIEYPGGEREYYDLEDDPFQLESRHANPATASRRAILSRLLDRLKTCAGGTCQVAAAPP